MTGVSVSELGNSFVWTSFRTYWGSCLFPLLFIIGIVWTLIRRKKDISLIFVGYLLILICTVYNPFFVKILIPKLDFELEYYRFFWVLPVIPGVAYYMVKMVFSRRKKAERVILAFLAAAVIICTGTPLNGVVTNFSMAENLYKVPDDLRAVCAVIHGDSNEENPRVLFDRSLNYRICQYDASFDLVLSRNMILYWGGSTAVSVKENSRGYQRAKLLMDATFGEMQVDTEDFVNALVETKTDYMVMPTALTNHDFFRESGCEPIAQTNYYVIYRFDWEARV